MWAFSSRTAKVVRIDPRTGRRHGRDRIATRRGSDKPYPVGIATTPGTVWVLNGNTAEVSRLDAAEGGVRNTVAIGMDRLPRGIGAAGSTVWVANFDGSVWRIARAGHALVELDRRLASAAWWRTASGCG